MEHFILLFVAGLKNMGKLIWRQYGISQLHIKALMQVIHIVSEFNYSPLHVAWFYYIKNTHHKPDLTPLDDL